MKRRASIAFAIVLFAIAGCARDHTLDIGKEHPPDITHTFTGIVQRIDPTSFIAARRNDKRTFLLADCSEAPAVKLPPSALHRPVEVTYAGDRDPYCAVKVRVLASLPAPTPKEENMPIRHIRGTVVGLQGEHLTVGSARGTRRFVIDVLTEYYDRGGYIIINPHPASDLRVGTPVELSYSGSRGPFRVRTVKLLR